MKIKLLYLPIVVENYEEDLRSTAKQPGDDLRSRLNSLRIEMPFTYKGHEGSLIYDRGRPAELHNSLEKLFYTLKIDSHFINLPSLVKPKRRFDKMVDVEVDTRDTICCSAIFALGIWLDSLGLLPLGDKIETNHPNAQGLLPNGKALAISKKGEEISKITLPVDSKDRYWGVELIDFLLEDSHYRALDLRQHPELFQPIADFLNNFIVEINERDYNNLIPRELYVIDDYDFKEYIESKDFFDLQVSDTVYADSRDISAIKRDYKSQIDRMDKYNSHRSKNREGVVTAEELIHDNLESIEDYISSAFRKDFEEKYQVLFKGENPEDALENFFGDKIVNTILKVDPDFWEEAEKALQKDLDKNPYSAKLEYSDNIKDYLKVAKRFNHLVQDTWDDLIDVYYEQQNE